EAGTGKRSAGRRLSDLFHGRPRLQVGALLAGPIGWLVVAYLGSLAVMFAASFWTLNDFTGEIERSFSLENFQTIFTEPIYRTIAGRTIGVALLVTITDAILAFPIAFFMAKMASSRARALLVVAVLMPLWSSYLIKVYSWRTMLSDEGILNWALGPIGLSIPENDIFRLWLVMSYLWLPYMVIPLYAGMERIPDSLISASEDLGARPGTTFRRVVFPMALPALVAGSIFTFSLTLGDYIAPQLVTKTQFIGNVVYANIGVAGNLPLAAAFALVPVVVMIFYLLFARRMGAFDQL
ncbi:MAG: ABC transporter permease, partial [Solirubrobacterales bacterium]